MRTLPLLLAAPLLLLIFGCQEETPPDVKIPPKSPVYNQASQAVDKVESQSVIQDAELEAKTELSIAPDADQSLQEQVEESVEVEQERTPPTPPIKEDFQDQPKLSLFPRVGDYQPPVDSERHPYWRTFIDHLVKVTGVAENQEDGSRGWVFRSINSIDSLGYFAPLAVEPDTTYTVSFKLNAELPEGASAGIGVLEFNEFLWIGEQYTEETFKEHYRGVHEGKRLTGKPSGIQSFSFTTGPETRMIHLVLFRDGTHDRNALMFDDIEIK